MILGVLWLPGRGRPRARAAGRLDYPGIGPEHAWLNDLKRVTFLSATDDEAVEAFQLCSKLEGIIPALETAHALAKAVELAPKKPKATGSSVRTTSSTV